MPSGLKRDLGLPATTAIAIGAMVGSGIFILPGIAFIEAGGPAVVMAFLVSAVLVLPAAFSASEMATAMPEDGGSYVYVERGMGPLLGTIAGIGNWFMLSFKGALALIGGVPYLTYVALEFGILTAAQMQQIVLPLALGLALFFTVINIVSTSSTGSLQFVIVGLMVIVMGWFVVGGFPDIDPAQTQGAFSVGGEGFLAATALVFISYAGVIKVAAVAEEVKDPGTVIPRAMLGSLIITTALYVAIVYVAVGIVDVQGAIDQGLLQSDGEGAIMAIAADQALGAIGVVAVTVAALMALASTANAGLLSASRFPFAMARDNLAPDRFATVSERFSTPVLAIAVTGGMMMAMIAFLPIDQVAKFGSAFQIIVFILVNLALIGFREGAVEDYEPEFTSPLYPWMQIFGMVGGFVVLTQVGTIPFVGAAAITAISVAYYYLYARNQMDREGAARDAVRRSVGEQAVERTRSLFESDAEYDVLVATTDNTSEDAKRDMLRMATDLGRLRTTVVSVVEFLDIPHRVFAEDHAEVHDTDIPEWLPTDPDDAPEWFPDRAAKPPTRTSGGMQVKQDDSDDLSKEYQTQIEYREIDSEDHKRAIVDFATYEQFDLIVLERQREDLYKQVFGSETEWLLKNAPCDVMLVEDRGFDGAEEIAVVANRGAYDPLKLLIADAVAEETGAEINLIQAIPSDPPETQRRTIEDYHNELISLTTVPTRSTIVEADDEVDAYARFAESADLLITGVDRGGVVGSLRGQPGNQLVEQVDCTAVMVQTHDGRERGGIVRRLLMDYLFS
ncbi:MAG: amino acid permease [Natronomonas sp.]